MRSGLWLLIFGMAAAVFPAEPPTATPICSTVSMFHKWQMQTADKAVDKVAALGDSGVEFCITLVSELNPQYQPQNFGLLRENREGGPGDTFYPSDEALRAEFKGWCAAAFARAVEHRLSIAILLHLNSHGPIKRWRNDFDFDPLTSISGTSYADALVGPVMEALEAVVPADWPVEVSLQGEMGRTVFAHPHSWLTLLQQVRRRGKLRHAVFGLSLNYQEISGPLQPEEFDRAALQKLWESCDFIGVSMYQKLEVPPRAESIASNLAQFVSQFAAVSCPLPADKPLHIVEFGIGGGWQSQDGAFRAPAISVEEAARTPFVGTDRPEANPWANEPLRKLRQQTYAAFCNFLKQPAASHPVSSAYLWSYGSLDVHGLVSPIFADAEISRRVQDHNRSAKRPTFPE
ncbi:MAG: hypothetical protein H0X73_05075 [Chthoniobacterales bacterium]|nr:hypothetical protein [Chthoniobacterales bacterium]